MAADLVHTLELADGSYRASLATIERDTSRSMARMADSSRSAFARIEDAHKSISRPFAVLTGALGKVTFGIGLITSMVAALDQLANAERRVREELQAQTREREKALAAVRAANDSSARGLGFGSAAETAADARRRIDQEYQQRIDDIEGQISSSRGTVADLRQRSGTDLAIKAEESRQAQLEAERKRALDLREREKAAATSAAFAPMLERQGRLQDKAISLRVDALRAQGREVESLQLAEVARFDAEREAIAKLAGDNSAAAEALEAQARANHQAAMDRIRSEGEERTRTLREERAERRRIEAEARRSMRFGARVSGWGLDADEARARGDDAGARVIEERIRLARTLEEIRSMDGLSESERRDRSTQAARIAALRLVDTGRDRGAPSPTVEAGVVRSGSILGQVFGGVGQQQIQPAREDTARKQLNTLDGIFGTLRQLVSDPLRGSARFG